jgi:uncharacterized membrane protein (DUF4010 family)
MEHSVFIGFILALSLWALIGIERELPRRGTKPGGANDFGGIRTYASIAFFGAIMTWLDTTLGSHMWILIWSILSGILIIISYTYLSFQEGKMWATSEYAAFITYFIGVIAMLGQYSFAVILAIGFLLLLSSKEYLNKLKERFSREELGDSLKFAVIALIILPLLPDEKYSLLQIINWFYTDLSWTHPVLTAQFFNPHSIWKFVVIMAGVEYAGYLLSRMVGTKGGIILSGTIGGLISSTATTVAMTKKSTEHTEHRYSYVTATLLASCIMFLRVLIVAFVIYPPILNSIIIPGAAMFIGLTGYALFTYIRTQKIWDNDIDEKSAKEKWYESPFQLIPAIKFASLIVVIKFLAILGKIYEDMIPPEVSNYWLALISGLADVDAINMTYATGAKAGDFTTTIAATTILIAVMSNNVVKASIAKRFGEKEYGNSVIAWFGISIILGIIVILIGNIL